MNIFNWVGALFGGANNLTKTIIGSQQERDQQSHNEFQTVQKSYQAEYANSGGIFNAVVDGINRLVRPFFTFGTVGLFIWAIAKPEPFINAMLALSAMPIELWTIEGTIIAFWFGSKSIFGDKHKYAYKYKPPKILTKTVHTHEVITQDDTPKIERSIDLSKVDNEVIKAWLMRQKSV